MDKDQKRNTKEERSDRKDRKVYHRSGSTLRIMLIIILLPIFLVTLVTCGTCTAVIGSCGKARYDRYSEIAKDHGAVVSDSRIEELGKVISIHETSVSKPDSWGDMKLNIVWENTSDKVVKYATFYYHPYNAVGDRVSDLSDWGKDTRRRVTGPIEPGDVNGKGGSWGYWSNSDIVGMIITKVEIEYMDETTEEVSANEIEYVMK